MKLKQESNACYTKNILTYNPNINALYTVEFRIQTFNRNSLYLVFSYVKVHSGKGSQ